MSASKINCVTNKYEYDLWKQNKLVAGIDEVGRGCLAGPVVSSAVIFPKFIQYNKEINDSKALKKDKRNHLNQIIKNTALSIGIYFVNNEIIDEINIREATLLAMNEAVSALLLKPDYLLVDGNYFKNNEIEFSTIIKGDAQSFSIAAASIIAKVARDNWMSETAHVSYPEYNFAIRVTLQRSILIIF